MENKWYLADFFKTIITKDFHLNSYEIIDNLVCVNEREYTQSFLSKRDIPSYVNGRKRMSPNTIRMMLERDKAEQKRRIRSLVLQRPDIYARPFILPTQYVSDRVDKKTIQNWQMLWGQGKYIDIIVEAFVLAIQCESYIEEEKKEKDKVFIVHGHDNAVKQEMARVLDNAGFETIILHEQPDTGLTIIEKMERYTDVNYAVVLYTECDLGRSKREPVEKEKNRARQNVVFEHGYLIGKLGRDHVSAVVKGDVETPGDISGVVYIKMDEDGAWKMALARNMKAVGLQVDMNEFL